MVTKRRIWFEGAIYHVTVRGNNKDNIFLEERDFNRYLRLIKETKNYYSNDENQDTFDIICYCLMDNHVHLLIKSYKKPISFFMGRLNSVYTLYFNYKYGHVGHLFQGRYHSEIIKDEKQMLEVSRYIHMNPVRAAMVKKPEEYRWSSYSMFINNKDETSIIKPSFILNYFSDDLSGGYNKYKAFVEEKL